MQGTCWIVVIKYRMIQAHTLSPRNAFCSLSFLPGARKWWVGASWRPGTPGTVQGAQRQGTTWYLSVPSNLSVTTCQGCGRLAASSPSHSWALLNPAQLSPACQAARHSARWTAWKNAGAEAKACLGLLSLIVCIYLIIFAISSLFSFLALGWLMTRLSGITSNYTTLNFSLHFQSTGEYFSTNSKGLKLNWPDGFFAPNLAQSNGARFPGHRDPLSPHSLPWAAQLFCLLYLSNLEVDLRKCTDVPELRGALRL